MSTSKAPRTGDAFNQEREPVSAAGRPLDEIFGEALEVAPDRRDDFVRAQCEGDEELLASVLSLLDAHAAAANNQEWSDRLDPDAAMELLEAVHGPALSDRHDSRPVRVGPYELGEVLGQGGMGTVYRAERVDGGFTQEVALKLVRPGMNSAALLSRFERERQVLATLEHPNIARLLDGGLSDDGSPFFAMELVRGVSLSEYCKQHRLGIKQRLRLFCSVCDAVQHAHNNLVVHRDLKPSNILVDESGQLKLLDFGIAKVLTPDPEPLDASSEATETSGWAMTPDYAAPEQLLGGSVTTASDVYSLGVVLYGLLSGTRPHEADSGSREVALRRALGEEEPNPPSRVASSDEAGIPGGQGSLARQLRGDLDAITLKTLRKEPAARYGTALALGEDIVRFLDGLPVQARRHSRLYRARKFARRHRSLLVAAGLVLTVLAIAGVALVRAQERTARERDSANEVKNFVLGLFELSDPNAGQGTEITVGEMLDLGTERSQRDLAGQPEVQAEIAMTLARLRRDHGELDAARTLFEQALELRRGSYGDEHPLVAESLRGLAGVEYDDANYELSETLHREALRIARASAAESAAVGASLSGLSETVRARGRYEEAETLAREGLDLHRKLFGGDHPAIANSLVDVAVPTYLLTRYDEAEPLYVEALAMQRRLNDDQHLDVAEILNRLGLLYRRTGEGELAGEYLSGALETYRSLLGSDHHLVATVAGSLARVMFANGARDEAMQLAEEALEIQRRASGSDHPDVATVLTLLSSFYQRAGRRTQAIELDREALAIYESAHGPEHPYVAVALNNLAAHLRLEKRLAEAEQASRRLYELVSRLPDATTSQRIRASLALASVLRDLERFELAEPLFSEAFTMSQEHQAEAPSFSTVTLIGWGRMRLMQGDLVQARDLLERGEAELVARSLDRPDLLSAAQQVRAAIEQAELNLAREE